MKVLYSQLKKYLPDLKASEKEVTDVYTLTGFMLDKKFDVKYEGKDDKFFDLEVRQNRADAFGVKGLARELSAYYNIGLKFPEYSLPQTSVSYDLPIEVKAEKAVKRVMALKISNLEVKESPAWLKEYLELYEINSINNLVDLTNYVMLETGHASHAFDTNLMGGDKLVWEIDPSYKKFTTLSGEEVDLVGEALVISDGSKPLSLSIIGGKDVAINNATKEIVLEMAIYDGGLIRRNSRQMKIITEASQRLEKYLDPESIPQAFSMLVKLILEHVGGEVTSNVYDNYIKKTEFNDIQVDLDKVQQLAGIEITYEESKAYLIRLGFQIVNENGAVLTVKRPIDRLDIEMGEDIFEEIIRMKGYNLIPQNNLSTLLTKEITPNRITLVNQIEQILSSRGFDEVRSWVLVDSELNQRANFQKWEEIKVTNSINEEVPFLRQSISVSIIEKFDNYKKNSIPDIKLFENGKVFGKVGKEYQEFNSLGMLLEGEDINELKQQVGVLLRTLGLGEVLFKQSENTPKTAHPKTSWDIYVQDKNIGIIYLSNKEVVDTFCISEVNVDLIDEILSKEGKVADTFEVTQKLVELDVNVELSSDKDINWTMNDKLNSNENVWKWAVTDKFESGNKIKYTVKVYYFNLTDPEAKRLHTKIFGE